MRHYQFATYMNNLRFLTNILTITMFQEDVAFIFYVYKKRWEYVFRNKYE